MKEKIEAYFSSIRDKINIIRNVNKEIELRDAPRFSVFDYIDIDENKLSDIIADFLNPKGKHGQGNVFLLEFLKLINLENIDHNKFVSIRREVSTRLINPTQRRMDIVINFENQTVMIENKPWAADQYKQLSHYKEHLYRDYGEKFIIIYLASNNRKPSEVSIAEVELNELIVKNQFLQISFDKDLVAWIEKCLEKCKPQNIKQFLQDFKFYLLNNFNTEIA
ncbi:hypothetical protein GO495_00870 [Chitinophaga oryziterrae]|uniref:PD-(D/E)XK nuclease family protein n=1 Tax=Chitinophaga oryziterrae TaxID=1031224 RepID=A0A6N8J1R1_9BACT|nr:PD-(D/E)XK nuclease family protein [Chitinophaga oryziterrae]MVT39120.1 hypothetical protein [Chitinophaga oryziterrae]